MSQSISWKFQVQVKEGPSLAIADALSMEAYEKTRITIAAAAVNKVVNLAANAALLVVSANIYSDGDAAHKITYKLNNADSAIDLPNALVLVGKAVVDKFAAGVPLNSLSFTSTFTDVVTIDILTARDATP
jgi:hypothetical protein